MLDYTIIFVVCKVNNDGSLQPDAVFHTNQKQNAFDYVKQQSKYGIVNVRYKIIQVPLTPVVNMLYLANPLQ
jgi:hypothetical protein